MHVAVEGFSSSFCKPLQRLENYYCSLKVWLHSEGATQETAKNTLADSSFGFAHKPRRYVVNEFVIGGNGFTSTSRVYSVEELTVTMATHATSQPTPLTPGQRSQCEGPGNRSGTHTCIPQDIRTCSCTPATDINGLFQAMHTCIKAIKSCEGQKENWFQQFLSVQTRRRVGHLQEDIKLSPKSEQDNSPL